MRPADRTGPAGTGPGGTGAGRVDPAALLELAVAAAGAAGRLLTGRDAGAAGSRESRPKVVRTKSSPTDVVTEMDHASEALVMGLIRAQRPGDAFLGEEGGSPPIGAGADAPQVRWIVDPIDGTVNYLYGLPDWAVSIAAEVWDEPGGFPGGLKGGVEGAAGSAAAGEHAGRVSVGVVAVPERGEVFTAIRGGGAWLHRGGGARTADHRAGGWAGGRAGEQAGGRAREEPAAGGAVRLRCNTGVPLERALVGTGFGYVAGRRVVQGEIAAALLPQVRDIRRGGSCAVDLCSVAAGRLDAFYERGTRYWDRAAGGLIAREAGARVEGLHAKPDSPDLAIVAGPGLFGQLHDLLAALDPERDAV